MLVPFHHILQQSLLFYPVMSRAGGTSGERDPFPEHQQLFQSSSRGLCGSAPLPFAPCVALCLHWVIPVVSVPLPLVPWGPFAILCNHIYPSVLQKNFPCQQAVSACLIDHVRWMASVERASMGTLLAVCFTLLLNQANLFLNLEPYLVSDKHFL